MGSSATGDETESKSFLPGEDRRRPDGCPPGPDPAADAPPDVGQPRTERAALAELVVRLTMAARRRGERALLVVAAPLPTDPPPGRDGRPGTRTDRADRLAARLGTERTWLVHDARERLDPALLAAEAGTVRAGGLLALVLADGAPSRFGARLERHLRAHLARERATSARIALPDTGLATLCAAIAEGVAAPSRPSPLPADPGRRDALRAQDALLERAFAHLAGGSRPLVVVEAPRGHGKSALLGRLVARLQSAGTVPSVCAAHRSALTVLERHRRLAHAAEAGGDRVPPPPPPFLAPDAALAADGDTLLVDEAASLPLPTVEALLGRYRRVVLATTSEGHESAGRAFALRLPSILDRVRPGWLRLVPARPLRWRTGDPLDALIGHVALPAPRLGAPPPVAARHERLVARAVDRDALADDDVRLASVAGLLAATHYQSTPLDVVHLLDAPNVRLWCIERETTVLAAASVAIEPGIEPALHDAVLARRRRPPHRLLPQLLAQSADRADALGASFARIVRIAVHPAWRRRGLGGALLDGIVRDTAGEVEALGASFGESAAARAFWRACGFTVFHRGRRRNPRSGRRSVAVLRAGSPRTAAALAAAVAIHRDNARARRGGRAGGETIPDGRLLRRFADGERPLDDALGALRRLTDGDADDAAAGARELLRAALDAPAPTRRRNETLLRVWTRERLGLERAPDPTDPADPAGRGPPPRDVRAPGRRRRRPIDRRGG